MRFLLILTVLTVLLGAGSADAQGYHLAGSGAFSCGSWTAYRHEYRQSGLVTQGSQSEQQAAAWVLGFLSGIGAVHQNGDDPLDGVDGEGVWAWIDNYCQAHPVENIGLAAAAFYHAHPHR
jgi:hypothetical protein